MQYTLIDLLQQDHILAGVTATDAASAIHAVNACLVTTGHTQAGFAADACKRETTFPTGLPTQPVAIAIPHADPDHVLSSAVGIATLHSPVKFGQMGTDGSVILDVHAIFLLAIREREKQVEMIQQLMAVIQDQVLLTAIIKADGPGEILDLIRQSVKH